VRLPRRYLEDIFRSPPKEKTNPLRFSNAVKSRYRELNVERLKTLSEEVSKTLDRKFLKQDL